MPLLVEGAKAPDFAATAHDGSPVRLADFAGRHLLLWFYPKADTRG
jgi:thioredoxin-dependent peroxiredoxin